MKRISVSLVLLFVFYAVTSYAQEQISSGDAKDNIGKTVQVKGKVANIFVSQKGNTFINFDDKSPNQTFTVVLMSETNIDISQIKEESILTVYGEIKEYKGKPEIILENSSQVISVEK
jgi:DNA/RNA endonuclease YhcR with UshA esterase domain